LTAQVLVVTNEQDLDADRVITELVRRDVDVLRCNTERLTDWRVTVEVGHRWRLTDPSGRTATSESVRAVWWRRPETPSRALHGVSAGRRQALDDQWQALTEGLATVGARRWVSHPAALRRAEDKLLQLKTATEVGFAVPATAVVNDLGAAVNFLEACGGRAVAKSLTAAHWETPSEAAFVFASLIDRDDLPADPATLRRAPVLLQQPIIPKLDVRATVVGDRVLAAETPPTTAEIDWRLEPDRPWRAIELSASVTDLCRQLVAALELRFSGIDLAISEDGTAWFLEANPNGEWGWLVDAAGLPVPAALADELTA
jgi:hypothetical protein